MPYLWARAALALGGVIFPCLGAAQAPPSLTQAVPAIPIGRAYSFDGYFDLYYQVDFGRPPHSETVNGRWYDIDHDSYQLAAAQFDFSKSLAPRDRFGFTVNVLEGSNSEILAATEPGGVKSYKDFSQAFISYLVPGRVSTQIDFGKWYAFVGYEGLDSRTQDNYSRSFTFTGMEPDYMTGFRISSTFNPRLSLDGYLYQGYNEVKNSNSTIMTGVGMVYALTDKLTTTLQGYNGKESDDKLNEAGTYGGIGFPTARPSWVTQENLVTVYQVDPYDKLAFDGTYASAVGKGNWNGEAVYYRRTIGSHGAACVRVERAEDDAGLRFYNGGMILHSGTGTLDYAVNKNLLLRLELRRDFASKPFFNSEYGPSVGRTTLTFAQILKF